MTPEMPYDSPVKQTQQEEQGDEQLEGEELEEKNEEGPAQKSSITPKIYAPKVGALYPVVCTRTHSSAEPSRVR